MQYTNESQTRGVRHTTPVPALNNHNKSIYYTRPIYKLRNRLLKIDKYLKKRGITYSIPAVLVRNFNKRQQIQYH